MDAQEGETYNPTKEIGRQGALSSTLHHIIQKILGDEQKQELLDWLSSFLDATRTVIDRRGLSDNLEGLMQGYEIAAFRVRESQKLITSKRPEGEIYYLICVRCNFPVAYSMDCVCPVCGKIDMLQST